MRRCLGSILAVQLLCTVLLAQQSSKVSYDGQKVASVELVGNPKMNVDEFRPLVQQKAGIRRHSFWDCRRVRPMLLSARHRKPCCSAGRATPCIVTGQQEWILSSDA